MEMETNKQKEVKALIERLNTVREGMEAGLGDWPISSMIWEYREAANKLAELEQENSVLRNRVAVMDGAGQELGSRVAKLEQEAAGLRKDRARAEGEMLDFSQMNIDLRKQFIATQKQAKMILDVLKLTERGV